MVIFRHHRSNITLSRLATLSSIALTCIFLLWIATPLATHPNSEDIPSSKHNSITRRDAGVQTVAQMAVYLDERKKRPRIVKQGSKVSDLPVVFEYSEQNNQKRKSKIEKAAPDTTPVVTIDTFKDVYNGNRFLLTEVKYQKTFGSVRQGRAYFGYTGETDYLDELFDRSKDSEHFYPTFMIGSDKMDYFVIPEPTTTLAGVFSGTTSGEVVDKKDVIRHMPGLFTGIRHLKKKGLWSTHVQPDNVFLSTKKDPKLKPWGPSEITAMQWAIAPQLHTDPTEETNIMTSDIIPTNVWKSFGM